MSMTDPVADFLTRVRNAIQASHETVEIPASKLKIEMARILREQGYINAYELEAPNTERPGSLIRITLKYAESDRRSAISGLKRVSRPGLRVYRAADGVPRVLSRSHAALPACMRTGYAAGSARPGCPCRSR